MSHPIIELQTSFIEKLNADPSLVALVGTDGVFDSPPKRKSGPYVVVLRHDVLTHDFDLAPGFEHRVQLRAWVPEPSRKSVLEIADRVVSILLAGDLSTPLLRVVSLRHQRTDTAIDLKSGRAIATMGFRVLSEPVT